jgi:CDP-diacylglycerol--glycerol-3-phosphate 3-phosphatidyltransferase
MLNLPNILTLVRILVIPFFITVYYLPIASAHVAATILFTLACITDWLDGYLARSLKQSTRFGAFLDPVADKMMVSIALVMIVAERQFQYMNLPPIIVIIPAFVVTIPAAIIVSREIIVSALREWMAELGKRASVVVSSLGKVKTTVQMLALIVLIYCDTSTSAFIVVAGYILLWLAAVLTLWSMVIYLKAAWPELRAEV